MRRLWSFVVGVGVGDYILAPGNVLEWDIMA